MRFRPLKWSAIMPSTPLNRCRGVGVAALTGGLLLWVGCVIDLGEEVRETSQHRFDLATGSRLVVHNEHGKFGIYEIDDAALELEATRRVRARTRSRAQDLVREIRVDVVEEGRDLIISVEYPSEISRDSRKSIVIGAGRIETGGGVDLDIGVPAGTPIRIETVSGDLSTAEYAGDLRFHAKNGDLHLDRFRGDIVAMTRSGDVFISELEGSIEYETKSGDFAVGELLGDLRFDSASGDATIGFVSGTALVETNSGEIQLDSRHSRSGVRAASGDVRSIPGGGAYEIRTSSGDVDAHVTESMQSVFVQTSSGDVRLVLHDPLRGRVQIRTSSGEIAARVPISPETVGRTRLIGRLGPGDGLLEVRTSSGDVDLVHAETRDR